MAAQPLEERKDDIKQARQRIHVVPVERQRTVYDEKGISYPRITTKPAKVPENEYSAPEDAVQVMTVHKSKGLEFDAVFIPKLENGEFPVRERGGRKYWHVLGGRFEERKDRYTSDLEDERKLFYVGVTRAKRYLFLSCQNVKHSTSPFVYEAAQSEKLKINRGELA